MLNLEKVSREVVAQRTLFRVLVLVLGVVLAVIGFNILIIIIIAQDVLRRALLQRCLRGLVLVP